MQLLDARSFGSADCYYILLSCNGFVCTQNAYTPLHCAFCNDHVEVVKILLADSRVDVNKEDKVRKTTIISHVVI